MYHAKIWPFSKIREKIPHRMLATMILLLLLPLGIVWVAAYAAYLKLLNRI